MPLNLFKLIKPKQQGAESGAPVSTPQDSVSKETVSIENKNLIENLNSVPEQIIDIEAKEKQNLRKKRTFKLFCTVIASTILLSTFGPPIIKYYKHHFVRVPPIVENPDNNPIIVVPEEQDPESIVEYKNDILRLSLEHLRKAKLFENQEQTDKTKRVEIIYDKNNSGDVTSLDNLSEGYIFRISSFSTALRQIGEIAKVKKESFSLSCPTTATITEISEIFVNDIEGRTFEVKNCGADYKVTYVLKNGINYEFAQIFKGDYGYRQAYKAETEGILNSIKFYPDEPIDLGPLETYKNSGYSFSFDYPKSLDKECCMVSGPISGTSRKIMILGDPNTYIDENNLDVIGFFVDEYKTGSFDSYVEKQKNLLTDDYIVTKSESPKTEIREIDVGDRKGIMLRGYSWKGNDLIYIDLSESRTKAVLTISLKNSSGENFENTVNSILKSFKFGLGE
jgi:hypothetical protein